LMSSRLLDRQSVGGVDLLRGEVTSPAYDAVHQRTVLFVAGEYWLIFDTVRSAEPHDYAIRWHLADDPPPDLESPSAGQARVTTPTVFLDIVGPTLVTTERGWISTEYGVKKAAPVVVASLAHETDVDVVSLLAPRLDDRAPTLRAADPTSGAVVVDLPDGTADQISWRAPRLEARLARRGDLSALRAPGVPS